MATGSKIKKLRPVQEPQRKNGKLRVAAILQAATSVIAENGYEATTMAEIAARSDTQIGSLYRFFPSKEILAGAMIGRYCEHIDIVFNEVDAAAKSLSIRGLSNAFLETILELHRKGAATLTLMETAHGWSAQREGLREAALKRIAKTLKLYSPHLSGQTARDMAIVILHTMKAMAALSGMANKKARSGAVNELKEMTRLYLKNRLKKD